MTRRANHTVTDHAVLRYLERSCGVDVAALRRRIGRMARPGISAGAHAVKVQGLILKLGANGTVITVTGSSQAKSKRARRQRKRHRK